MTSVTPGMSQHCPMWGYLEVFPRADLLFLNTTKSTQSGPCTNVLFGRHFQHLPSVGEARDWHRWKARARNRGRGVFVDRQVPRGPRREPGERGKSVRPDNGVGVPGVRPLCARSRKRGLRGGCLRVGTRVRMENRVVGSAGFRPGTKVGGHRLPGPPWRARQSGFLLSTLGRFFTRTPEVTLPAGPCQPPPSTVGYPGSCAEPGFPLQLSSEWAPRRGEKAPRGQVVSRAKRHFVCFSAVCALKLFQSHSGNPCTPSAPLGPSPSASSPAHVGGVVWTGGCGLQARESVSKLWPCTGWVWFKAVGLN